MAVPRPSRGRTILRYGLLLCLLLGIAAVVVPGTTVPDAAPIDAVSPIDDGIDPTTLGTSADAVETAAEWLREHDVATEESDRPVITSGGSENGPTVAVESQSTGTAGDRDGDPVRVAVLDTGIDDTHPDLRGQVDERKSFIEDDGDALDPHGHGTHVAGVIAGTGAADANHTGVVPDAVLLDVQVVEGHGGGSTEALIDGIEWAVDTGDADVIALSLGARVDDDPEIAAALERATDAGVIVVTSAGNHGHPREIGRPGQPTGVLTVGASDRGGEVASYSSRGPALDGNLKPDLLAPGDGVIGPRSAEADGGWIDADRNYGRMSGTSAAAATVAGVAADLLATEPELSPEQIGDRLRATADPIPSTDPYQQGAGVVNAERALDPDVTADPATIDLGVVDTGPTTETVTLTNHDDVTHTLSFDPWLRNVDAEAPAEDAISVEPGTVELAPGESRTVTVRVDRPETAGAHGGQIEYTVDGDLRSIPLGFVRGGEVTVEKRSRSAGGSVDGDDLWVFTEEGTHDELLEFENGTASFVAGGGTYYLWSYGTDEPTGATIFLSERHRFDGPEHVVLDEADTVPVGVDVTPLEAEYGPLTNLSKSVAMSTDYGRGTAELSTSEQRTPSRTVLVSPDRSIDVATSYLLTTPPASDADMDVSDAFQLLNVVEGVESDAVLPVDNNSLTTTTYRQHRATEDQRLRVRDRIEYPATRIYDPLRWYDLGDRAEQRVHRLDTSARYERGYEGDGWRGFRDGDPRPDSPTDVLRHPLLGLVDFRWSHPGHVDVTAMPFADGTGTAIAPPNSGELVLAINGDPVHETDIRSDRATVTDVPIETGDTVQVRMRGSAPEAHLSTATRTDVSLAGHRPGARVDNDPSMPTDIRVGGTNLTNAVAPGQTNLSIGVARPNSAINPRVWYAANSTDTPPWVDADGWTIAPARMDGDRIHAPIEVPEEAETMSLAVRVGSIKGHETRTMTADAFHVGRAPNTSAGWITGRLVDADGSPAANETIVADRADGDRHPLRTDADGYFAAEYPLNTTVDLVYHHGDPWSRSTDQVSDRPFWAPLDRVTVEDDVELGTVSLPAAHEFGVTVEDERGERVENASVTFEQQVGSVTAKETVSTDESGMATRPDDTVEGVRLGGTVNVTVRPPDAARYPDQSVTRTVTLEDDRTETVTLETAAPNASLRALGSFEAWEPVALDAGGSDVPAGTVEYRWDLTGDGEIDRVTTGRSITYVPEPHTTTPRVTVVDAAGKTDTATVRLPMFETEPTGDG